MWIRTHEGKKKITVNDFYPYFYIEDDNGEYVSIFGKRLRKITVNEPEDVRKLRENYNMHYEADIPYTRRFMIDAGIYSGVEFPDREYVSWKEIKPCEVNIKPRVWFYDIEVLQADGFPDPSRAEQPIILITIYDTYEEKYITLINNGERKEKHGSGTQMDENGNLRLFFEAEDDMLFFLLKLFARLNPDVIIGWNVEFDFRYTYNRLKKFGYAMPNSFLTFDMCEAYKDLFKKYRAKLKDVAVAEGIITKDEVVEAKDLNNLYYNNIEEMIKYNIRDVYIMVELENRYKIFEYYWSLKTYAGVAKLEDTFRNSVLVDTLLLRLAKKKGIVLPSVMKSLPSVMKRNVERFKGAIVFDPIPGVHEDVAQFDMSRYYPSIIMSLNLSPEVKNGEKKGIIPELCEMLLKEREKYEAILKELEPGSQEWETVKMKITTIKYLTNSIYGYMGYQGSRLFDIDIASKVTAVAREGLLTAKEIAESMGFKVIYGDTDSIFIQCPFEKAEEVLEKINNEVRKRFMEKYNLKDVKFKLKFEKYNKRIIFTGAKKRYAAWVTWDKKECDYIHIAGFEAIRTDQSKYTKDVQRTLLEMIVKGKSKEEIEEYIKNVFEKFKEQPLEDIAILKGIDKPLDAYKVKPSHIRGALLANMYLGANFKQGDKVKMLYVKYVEGLPKTDVICFDDASQLEGRKVVVDWERMIDVSLKSKVEDILKVIGINVPGSRNVGQSKALSIFFGGDKK